MGKFKVTLSRTLEVEASSQEEAEEKAAEELNKEIENGNFFVGEMDCETKEEEV